MVKKKAYNEFNLRNASNDRKPAMFNYAPSKVLIKIGKPSINIIYTLSLNGSYFFQLHDHRLNRIVEKILKRCQVDNRKEKEIHSFKDRLCPLSPLMHRHCPF